MLCAYFLTKPPLGLQKETLGVFEAPVLVVSLPELCAHLTAPGAGRGVPGASQLWDRAGVAPPGLILSSAPWADCSGLQGAPDAKAEVAGSTISTVGTPNTLGTLHHPSAQGSTAAPAPGSENQNREGKKKRGLQPTLYDFFWWFCLSLQHFLIFCLPLTPLAMLTRNCESGSGKSRSRVCVDNFYSSFGLLQVGDAE